MSVEFIGSPQPPLTQESIESIRRAIKAESSLSIVRDEANTLGLRFASTAGSGGREEVAIALSTNEVYIGFHLGTAQQRAHVLGIARTVLSAHGVSCEFEEE